MVNLQASRKEKRQNHVALEIEENKGAIINRIKKKALSFKRKISYHRSD